MPGVTTAYQAGVHGSRPAASAGCILYSCSTHGLVYRSDGTNWTTWLTLPSGVSSSSPALTFGTAAAAGAASTYVATDATLPIFDATVPSTQAFADAAAVGVAAFAARRDHKHAMPASTAPGAWQTYTPTWTTDGSAPSAGNATLSGRYRLLDSSSMQITVYFVRGSTSTNGTGNYFFSMPGAFKAKNVGGLPQTLAAWLTDAGTANYAAVARILANGTTFSAIIADGTGVRQFGGGAPITLATSDEFGFTGVIEYE
jgi:hypothetical protein